MSREATLGFFAKYIERELGIIYAEHNYFQLETRLEEIAKQMGFNGLEALHAYAEVGVTGRFRQLLHDVATNNETSFFRDSKIFQLLGEQVFPELLKRSTHRPIRIWSAASSTGQEALSICMLLLESFEKAGIPPAFEVLGTDISERVLQKARSGEYSSFEVRRGLSDAQIARYFRPTGPDQWRVSETLLNRVAYRSLNLKAGFRFDHEFDLILCRNVLIYQNVQNKVDILARITTTLAPDGCLILGAGESLLGLSNEYDQYVISGAVLYKKKVQARRVA